jgi:hypothetical protein
VKVSPRVISVDGCDPMSEGLATRFGSLGVTVSSAGTGSGTFNCPTGGQRQLSVTCTLAGGSLLSAAIGGADCVIGNSSAVPLNVSTVDDEPLYRFTCSMGEGEGLFQSLTVTVGGRAFVADERQKR